MKPVLPFTTELPVAGRPVVVFGAGSRALASVGALRDAGAVVTIVAPQATASLHDLAHRGIIGWQERDYEPGDLVECWLAVAATDDAELNTKISDEAATQRLWCIKLDPPPQTRPGPDGGGEVILVGGGPGDPSLLTMAGHRALQRADVIVTDRLAPLAALTACRPDALVVDVAKIPSGRSTPQSEINDLLIAHAHSGRTVVRFKGGDNFVFGRGGEELQACVSAGLRVTVVPGLSSALAVPALADIPVTHRGLTQGFTVVSGHVPPAHRDCTVDYAALARLGTTVVLLMAVGTLPMITETLVAEGMDAETPAITIADGTLPTQHIVRGTLATIASAVQTAGISPPAITVIGQVAAFDPAHSHPAHSDPAMP